MPTISRRRRLCHPDVSPRVIAVARSLRGYNTSGPKPLDIHEIRVAYKALRSDQFLSSPRCHGSTFHIVGKNYLPVHVEPSELQSLWKKDENEMSLFIRTHKLPYRRCLKCLADLPIILELRLNCNGRESRTWKIYCKFCTTIRVLKLRCRRARRCRAL